jgi:hypothetical protein
MTSKFRLPAFLLLLWICAVGHAAPGVFSEVGADWTQTSYNGEKAWASRRGSVLAVISEARGRLLYLGKGDGSANLLSASFPCAAPTNANSSPNWGGHRFWLGPQARWIWPPLTEWEYSAAAKTGVDGDVLKLEFPRTNPDYPALTREYAWQGTRLRATVRWKDDGRAYYGMHVVAVQAPAEIIATPHKTDAVPCGLVAVRIDGYDVNGFLPHPAIREEDGRAHLRSGLGKSSKYAFPIQTLSVPRAEGWVLAMHPGPSEGVPVGASDGGLLSQVWVGNAGSTFAEIEQLSPLLLGDERGQCSSTCFLEAQPPKK